MLVAILLMVLIFLAVIVLGMWGVTTATTGATLAVSNATLSAANLASQAVMLLLTCVLIAMLPLAIYGAVRLGARKHRREVNEHGVPPIQIAHPQSRMLGEGRVIVLQLPESTSLQPKPMVRRVRKPARSLQQAVRVTRRWFT